jgi:hypothetical protein
MRHLVILLLLTGCASDKSLLRGSGMEVPPPLQWQVLCQERPELLICQPETKP